MESRYDLFDKVLNGIYGYYKKNGKYLKITFTPKNVAEGDRFLIFSAYKETTCTFKWRGDLLAVYFDNDEPMLLEECPDSFYRSILKNLPKE